MMNPPRNQITDEVTMVIDGKKFFISTSGYLSIKAARKIIKWLELYLAYREATMGDEA
jgi:hypothetical protein